MSRKVEWNLSTDPLDWNLYWKKLILYRKLYKVLEVQKCTEYRVSATIFPIYHLGHMPGIKFGTSEMSAFILSNAVLGVSVNTRGLSNFSMGFSVLTYIFYTFFNAFC